MNVFKKLKLNMLEFDRRLDVETNFDIIKREIVVGNKNACMYYIDGFVKDSLLQEITRFMLLTESGNITNIKEAKEYCQKLFPYMEVETKKEINDIEIDLLSGCTIIFIDGINEGIVADIREYPQRSITEPEKDKVIKGAKDGFIETPIYNVTLIRRRIRNKALKFEHVFVGEDTKSDVIICYMDDRVDIKKLDKVRDILNSIKVKSLDFGSESLVEAMYKKSWFNPLPKVQFIERPDVASANILEGRILLFMDNSPIAILIPTTFWDLFQEAQDFYFAPPVSNYLRITRYIISFLTIFAVPIWLLLVNNIDKLPEWMNFLEISEQAKIPIIVQIFLLDFIVNVIKTASINTPSMISNSISLIGAVIVGDIAIVTNIISPEVMLISAFSAMGFYSQPSFELGYSFLFMRMMLVLLVQFLRIWGLAIGTVIIILLIATNKTILGDSFIYPLVPFNFKKLMYTLFRFKKKV